MQVHTENRPPSEWNLHWHCRSTFSVPNRGSYLAFGCGNLCKECLGHFGALHFLLNLIINGSINVHGIVLLFPIPLSGNSSCFHLQNILNMTVIFHWPNCFEAFQARHPNWTLLLLLWSRWSTVLSFNVSYYPEIRLLKLRKSHCHRWLRL